MKKLLGSTLALAMFMPTGANAELLKNLKVGGQLDVQTTSARNINDFRTRAAGGAAGTDVGVFNDRLGHANTRLMLNAVWDVLDDVHGKVTLVKGAGNLGAAAVRTYGDDPQSVNDIQDTTIVQEAHVKIDKLFSHVDTTIGRQFYGEPGDLIVYFGPRDNYGLNVTSLDAFRADWSNEHMNVTGVAGRTTEGGVAGPIDNFGNAAVDLRGIVLSCNKHETVKPSVYVYNSVTHAVGALGAQVVPPNAGGITNGKNTNLYVAGVKAKIATGGLSAHVEVAKNFGEDRTNPGQPANYKGWAFLGKAAYKVDLPDMAMITPWGELGRGTGDENGPRYGNNTFQSIATDYRPGGIYGRFDAGSIVALGAGVGGFNGASNGLSNRTIWGLGVKATPASIAKLTVGGQFYRYMLTERNTQAAANIGATASRNIGSEIDVTAEWKHSENVSLKATAGTFQTGTYINDLRGAAAATNPAVMLAGDVQIRF